MRTPRLSGTRPSESESIHWCRDDVLSAAQPSSASTFCVARPAWVCSDSSEEVEMNCGCGCGKPILYQQSLNGFLRNHQPSRRKPVLNRLLSRVKFTDAGCWEWTGAITGGECGGYPCIRIDGHTLGAHRVSYALFKGEIPDGLEPDHTCKNRKCINPDHLEAVTHQVNVRRGAVGKLTAEIVSEIRTSKEPSRIIAARFGITYTYVNMLRRGLGWTDVCV
jgi:HNH endonuclease